MGRSQIILMGEIGAPPAPREGVRTRSIGVIVDQDSAKLLEHAPVFSLLTVLGATPHCRAISAGVSPLSVA